MGVSDVGALSREEGVEPWSGGRSWGISFRKACSPGCGRSQPCPEHGDRAYGSQNCSARGTRLGIRWRMGGQMELCFRSCTQGLCLPMGLLLGARKEHASSGRPSVLRDLPEMAL